MIILGYSGLDASVRYARRDPDLRAGEERMVQGLDSAAAILVDGAVLAAAAEERFCGEKHTNTFPAESIRYCLDAAGITANQIDAVAHGFDYGRYAAMFGVTDADRYETVLNPARQLKLWHDRLNLPLPAEKFVPLRHHLAHGASTYFPSGFTDALCVVCDGMGEVESLSVYTVRDGAFQLLDRHRIKDSLGILYGLVTSHLGFKFNADEYKVMGLAPYGNPEVFHSFFDSLLELHQHGKYRIRLDRVARDAAPYYRGVLKYLQDQVIARPDDTEILSQLHCDFAAAVQECLERALFHVIGYWYEQTGLRKLCMAGGVALNCTFNGKLAQSRLFDEIHVQPAAGDDGTALGAALATAHRMGEPLSRAMVGALPFYGPAYSKEEILAATRSLAGGLDIADLGSETAAADDAAAALAADQIVAWFQGRMEYGPRALGNRSILANPLIPDIKDRLNRIIKLREGFRPFAPAVAIEWAHDYFEFIPSSMFDYMLATCPVRPEWRNRLPGITHIDGSARMQTVDADRNALFHRLITSFGRITGIYCLVNTSFNLRGQPMIISPAIAVETFRKVGLDRLYMGPVRLCKRT
jgi:carbamoyltransferase